MSHELATQIDGRIAHAFVGEVGWHGLGNKLTEGATIEEWQAAAGMDWEIKRAMVRYPRSADDVGNPANWISMPDRHVLSRSDNDMALGIVSDKYEPVAPKEVLEFFRDLTEGAGFKLDTAGVLYEGRQFWALARVTADAPILDKADKVGGYLLLSTSADGTLATEGRFTTVRVVCHNTLSAARNFKGKSAIKVKHRTVFDGDALKQAMGISAHDAQEGINRTIEDFRRLASRKLTKADMGRMTLEAFGYDPKELEKDRKELERVIKLPTINKVQHLATGSGLIGADMAGAADTAWGWLNAVTQYTDHLAGRGDPSTRASSAWFGKGDQLKTKAYEVAMQHTGGTVTTYAPEPGGDDGGSLLDAVLSMPVGR